MKARVWLLASSIALCSLLTPVCAFALYEFPVCTSSYHQEVPAIWGNIVAWDDLERAFGSGGVDIIGRDLSTGIDFPICVADGDQYSAAISLDTVVWEEWGRNPVDVYGYDLGTGQEFPICTAFAFQGRPSVSGNIVVWQDERNCWSGGGHDIYGYNLSTGQEFAVCTAPSFQKRPAVSGNVVVWMDDRNYGTTGWDIYGYDLATGQEFPVCTAAGDQGEDQVHSLAISGNIVVWMDARNLASTGWDIYGYDLSTGNELPICTAPGWQRYPSVSGDLVVWEDWRNDPIGRPGGQDWGDSNADIYGYNLRTDTEFPVRAVPGNQLYPAVSGSIVVWQDNRNGNWDIYGASLESTGPPITSFTLTPSTLAEGTNVSARVTTIGATGVMLSITGLRLDQPDVPMSWDGSGWVATISGALAAWAASGSLTVTATAYDGEGHSAMATRNLPIESTEPPGDPGDPNAIWVDETGGCGIFTGSYDILGIGPPLSAHLSVTTVVTGLLGGEGPMNIWPQVVPSTAGEANVTHTEGDELGAVLSRSDRCSPLGGPTYLGTFGAVTDTATFAAHMDATAFGLTLWDTLANGVAAAYGFPNVSPKTLLQTYDAFANLAPVQKALDRLQPLPSTSEMPGAVLLAAWDLSELVTNRYEAVALGQTLEALMGIHTGDPGFEFNGSGWLTPVRQALSFWQLMKIWRDLIIWGVQTWNGDPYLTYHVYHTHTGSPAVRLAGSLMALGSVAREAGVVPEYTVTTSADGELYDFAVANTGGTALWEFRLEFTPSAPVPVSVSAPAGWQGEIVWNESSHCVRWYTQGPGGWASGDFGSSVIEPGAALSGFQVTLPERLEECAFSAMDTNLRLDAGMLAMMPGIVAAPPEFAPSAGEVCSLLSYLDQEATASVAVYRKGSEYVVVGPPQVRPPGEFEAIWDGRDSGGSLAPVGEYEARLLLQYSSGPTQVATPVLVGFSDIPWDFWAGPHVYALVSTEIVAGYPDGTYQPANPVTRDQMAVYISRALAGGEANVPPGPATATFPDVPTDHWAFKYVEYAVAERIVAGYPDGTYQPDWEVDRGQMAVFVARARGWVSLGDDMTTAPELFPDVPAGFWAGTAIQACVDNGVVHGYDDGYYHPDWTGVTLGGWPEVEKVIPSRVSHHHAPEGRIERGYREDDSTAAVPMGATGAAGGGGGATGVGGGGARGECRAVGADGAGVANSGRQAGNGSALPGGGGEARASGGAGLLWGAHGPS